MSRSRIPYQVDDIAALARTIAKDIQERQSDPSHVEWLNLLAKAAGFKNFQHLRADQAAMGRLQAAKSSEAPIDHKLIEKTLRCLKNGGILQRWPTKEAQIDLCLWWLWSRLPANDNLSEVGMNLLLKAYNSFEDHALLRRALVDYGFVDRTRDGSSYQRREMRPSKTAETFINTVLNR